jgi:hypothetical protein
VNTYDIPSGPARFHLGAILAVLSQVRRSSAVTMFEPRPALARFPEIADPQAYRADARAGSAR